MDCVHDWRESFRVFIPIKGMDEVTFYCPKCKDEKKEYRQEERQDG